MYTEQVITRMGELKNAGALRGANARGVVGDMHEGAIIRLALKIDDKGMIQDAKFRTFGCVPAIVGSDVLCDLIRKKSVIHARALTPASILVELGGMPESRASCAIAPLQALDIAIKNWEKAK